MELPKELEGERWHEMLFYIPKWKREKFYNLALELKKTASLEPLRARIVEGIIKDCADKTNCSNPGGVELGYKNATTKAIEIVNAVMDGAK